MCENQNKVDVSVLVITYNPDREKLIQTLNSILLQKGIEFEIVISDDGSDEDYFEEAEAVFKSKNFGNYKLIKNKINQGTVKNIYFGLMKCRGEFLKLISPGDFLCRVNTLENWVKCIKKENAELSFGNIIYYRKGKKGIETIPYRASPQEVSVYHPSRKNRKRAIMERYLFLNDTIHGGAVLCKARIWKRYISKAVDQVIYAEDCLYRLMIMEGIKICYYEDDVLFYEYGTGISTANNDKWTALIKKDLRMTDNMILQANQDRWFKKRFLCSITVRDHPGYINKIKKYLLMPHLLYAMVNIKRHVRYTNVEIQGEYILPFAKVQSSKIGEIAVELEE